MPHHPHILILYADQMQHSRMGFVDGVAHTPNLDLLAREGVHFTHAITEQGQCVPSRAVWMTGQSAHECGVMVNYGFFDHQNRLTRRHRTLGHTLKEAGYTTAYFGKGHLGAPLADLGFDHGRVNDRDHKTSEGGCGLSAADARRLGCEYVPPSIAADYQSTEEAVTFLRGWQPGASPLCCVLSLHFPHPPFFSERRFINRFPPERMPVPESFHAETFADKPAFVKARAAGMRASGYDETALRRQIADYYSMIAAADDHFGQVMAEFRRLGIWDDTLVFFTADHGDMMGGHGIQAKGTYPYDELFRVPCLFKLPASLPPPARRTVDDLVSSQAFPGTLLALAGLEVPPSFTGGDFAPAFRRTVHPADERVFFEHYCAHWGLHPFYGVRTRSWKYVRYYGADATEELYDLARDPGELRNLAFDPAHAAVRADFASQTDTWWQSTGGRTVDYYESPEFKANRHNAG
jgi:arylsulfatase A-like enzyme